MDQKHNVIHVFTPTVFCDLSAFPQHLRLKFADKKQLLFHFILGLEYLHEQGFMHRNISQHNLALTYGPPAQGLITGFHCGTLSPTSHQIPSSRLSFWAPEIVAIRQWQKSNLRKDATSPAPPSYTCSVDVWSMGLCAIYMWKGRQLSWKACAQRLNETGEIEDVVTSRRLSLLRKELSQVYKSPNRSVEEARLVQWALMMLVEGDRPSARTMAAKVESNSTL